MSGTLATESAAPDSVDTDVLYEVVNGERREIPAMGAMPYICSHCGETHHDLPDLGADRPDHWWDVPAPERARRIRLTSDTCILDGEHNFIRGVLLIPVHDHPRPFGFGVWVSQKRENFRQYLKHPNTSRIGPFFGWLCTRIAYYPDTSALKTMVHFRDGNLRPWIELEPTDHPLAVDQREGITLAKAWEIVHYYEGRQPGAGT